MQDSDHPNNGSLMPTLFVGHGSPMNAVEDNEFSRNWAVISENIPTPKAILCISAHWATQDTEVTAAPIPETVHDFYGFPPALYDISYPSPGAPPIANRIREIVSSRTIQLNSSRGIDHGTWVVLRAMYPKADIPTLQLSLDINFSAREHYELGKELLELRREGVLIVGSGNIVHNLALARMNHAGYSWAYVFDEEVARRIDADDHEALISYELLPNVSKAFMTTEHYLPLLYVLALKQPHEKVTHSAAKVIYGSISMRCILIQ